MVIVFEHRKKDKYMLIWVFGVSEFVFWRQIRIKENKVSCNQGDKHVSKLLRDFENSMIKITETTFSGLN